MNSTMTARGGTPLRGNFVLLRADALRLLLPQPEVGIVEYLGSMPKTNNKSEVWSQSSGVRRLAALSSRMQLLPRCPADRFLVTALGDEPDGIAWCWSEIHVLIEVELWAYPLPRAIKYPGAPVDQYVEHAGQLAFLCNAYRVREFALSWR